MCKMTLVHVDLQEYCLKGERVIFYHVLPMLQDYQQMQGQYLGRAKPASRSLNPFGLSKLATQRECGAFKPKLD